jgi:Peptidase M15
VTRLAASALGTFALGAAVSLSAAGSAGAAPIGAMPGQRAKAPDPFAAITSLMVAPPPDARLPAERGLDLMRRFVEPWVERPGEWHRFWTGRYGPGEWLRGEDRLSWSLTPHTPGLGERPALYTPERDELPALELAAPAGVRAPRLLAIDPVPVWSLQGGLVSHPALVAAATATRCQPWQHAYSVTVARYGGEHDAFRLLECDGSIAVDALDRLSVLARPTDAALPELPLPLEPDAASSERGEWVPGVRLLDPRLLWVLARISEAFPNRAIYLISGYRREGASSLHHKGRALDLFVMGVRNESVFALCRKLRDVGCGFYPNNKFVHVDVRPPNTGHAYWVDISRPGKPSQYVDSWPGVVEGGALTWGNGED